MSLRRGCYWLWVFTMLWWGWYVVRRLADWLSIDVITARLLLTLSVHHVVMGLVCGETVSWLTVHWCHYGKAAIDFECSPCCDGVGMWWDGYLTDCPMMSLRRGCYWLWVFTMLWWGWYVVRPVSWLTVHWCHYGEAAIDCQCSPCCDSFSMWWDWLTDWLSIDVITSRLPLTASVHHAVIVSLCDETG